MSNEFYCKICDVPCSGKAPYDQHIASVKHLKKAKLFSTEIPSSSISSPSETSASSLPSTSETARVSSSTELSAETMKILLEWKHPLNYPPFCNICLLPLHGGNNADIHFAETNQMHQTKLTIYRQIQEGSTSYSCRVCSEIFSNEFTMVNHFESTIHGEMVEKKADLQKFIQVYETFRQLKAVRKEAILAENQLENQFQQLTVADIPQSPQTPKKASLIDPQEFQKFLQQKLGDDDDDE